MSRSSQPLLAAGVLAFSVSQAQASLFEFTGTAKDGRNNLLYQEVHQVEGHCAEGTFHPLAHSVRYLTGPDGDEFAEKQLTYRESPLRPEVDFTQPTFNERLQITYPEASQLGIEWRTPNGKTESFSVGFDERVVVDAGFDHLVRANWDRVTEGKSVEFRFLGPTRGEHYGFVLEPTSHDQVAADVVVRIRPTSFVLRFLVDPIVLGYNRDGALTDYFGLTNIREQADKNYTAHIRYQVDQYPDCELTP